MNRDLDRAWETILSRTRFDGDRPALVTARDMKEWTGREPRLLAKMDDRAAVPAPLRDAGRFLFPVSGSSYALIRGDGYHDLEPSPAPLPHSWGAAARYRTLDLGTGESRAVDTALHTGMIERAFGLRERPALTLRGRRFAPPFSFLAGGHRVAVDPGVQFELDAGFDAGHSLLLLEAKVGQPADFWIRQLYVPFRAWSTWLPDLPVRLGFLVFHDGTGEYRFWSWRQGDPDLHGDLHLESAATFVLTGDAPLRLDDLLARVPARYLPPELELPQADRVERVLEVPLQLTLGRADGRDLARAFGFGPRQGNYYLAAARSLGLVEMDGPPRPTPDGRALAHAGPDRRAPLAAAALLGLPVLREAIREARARPDRILSRELVERVAAARGSAGPATAGRRAGSVMAYLRWLALRVEGLRAAPGGRDLMVEGDR